MPVIFVKCPSWDVAETWNPEGEFTEDSDVFYQREKLAKKGHYPEDHLQFVYRDIQRWSIARRQVEYAVGSKFMNMTYYILSPTPYVLTAKHYLEVYADRIIDLAEIQRDHPRTL